MNYIKSSFIALSLLAMLSDIVAGAYTAYPKSKIRTIVLIEGQAHLVELSNDGKVMTTFGLVDSYFISDISYEAFLQQAFEDIRGEVNLKNIRFVAFQSLTPEINEEIVDYITDLAVQLESMPNSKLVIGVNQMSESKELSLYMSDLLLDFGVKKSQIELQNKIVTEGGKFKFLKIEFVPEV